MAKSNNIFQCRKIKGFLDYYATSKGDIYSDKNKSLKKLSFYVDKDGYFSSVLRTENKSKTVRVNRVIAITFIKTDNQSKQVNHIDGNKQNNSIKNLEWLSCSDNHRHAYRLGLKNKKGVNHHLSKLDDDKVREIRALKTTGMTDLAISKVFNVSRAAVNNIINNKRWSHVK